ncbi:helix-turn-helix transcriptional regulator [Proteobacteria bacterium 005FR1]|nr:helix-turn-helix transcriptional regulator [Proteobacteria bacterium 005FR1]
MHKTIGSANYARLVKWLADARTMEGLSMRDVARLIDKPHSFIQKVESLERRLDVHEYVQYCKALKVDPLDAG